LTHRYVVALEQVAHHTLGETHAQILVAILVDVPLHIVCVDAGETTIELRAELFGVVVANT
jgi:hypothetical protein